ncbi:hypothetical protein [Poseidonocella sp. HB161398]|uniref:hypothetical protein n=1 Tax=Poseidonocella sp. HB161398 TaxID=2320855 RepID=UPI00110815C0|nr:hypothetical protein [Poseidonocella sp. HB161398]
MPARPVAAAASPVPRPRPLQAELAAAAGAAMERALAPIAAARVVIHHAAGSEAPRALAGKLRQAGAGEVEIRKVGFPVRSPSVRYFRAGDREKAAAACRLSFGTCRDELADFTGYRPLPRAGTVEVWLP